MKTYIKKIVDEYKKDLFDENCLYNEAELTEKLIKDLNTLFELRKVGGSLPTKEQMFSESQKEADKYSQGIDVQNYNAFNRGFEKCFDWYTQQIKVKR